MKTDRCRFSLFEHIPEQSHEYAALKANRVAAGIALVWARMVSYVQEIYKFLRRVSTWPDQKGVCLIKNLFEQYREGKGTLVISFNDATTVTGDFIKEEGGFL